MDNPSPLGPSDLATFLRAHAIPGELLQLDALTPTVEAAAQAVGTEPDNIVKSILFLVGAEPVLAITCGQAYVERRQIAALYGVVLPGASLDTHRAAGVPGTVAGMALAHERYGTLPWATLLEPAIRLAEDGWVLDPGTAAEFATETRNRFGEYFRGVAGTRFRQPELAATLRRIAEHGREGFYQGETARLIVAEMERGGELVTAADLAGYRPRVRVPVSGAYRGLHVVSMPPPSSGGVALIQMLHLLAR